jgi:hypothetical protein
MLETARRHGRVFSGGSQRVWGDYVWFHKMLWGGAIGERLAWVRCLERDGAPWRVEFREQAERACLPVALASMTAKLVRELMMERFNAFFHAHQPEVKPTAGYVQDARRFLAETAELRGRLGIRDADVIRQR